MPSFSFSAIKILCAPRLPNQMLPPSRKTSSDIYPAFPILRFLCSVRTDSLRRLVALDYLESSFLLLPVLLASDTVPGTCDACNTSLFHVIQCFPKSRCVTMRAGKGVLGFHNHSIQHSESHGEKVIPISVIL